VDNACDCPGHLLAVAQRSDSRANSGAFRQGEGAEGLVHDGFLWPLPGRALMIGGEHRLQALHAAGVPSSTVSGSKDAAARRLTLALQDVEDF